MRCCVPDLDELKAKTRDLEKEERHGLEWLKGMVGQVQVAVPSKFVHFGGGYGKSQARGALEKARFQFLNQVGDGTYGRVYLAKALDAKGKLQSYAIKMYSRCTMGPS